MIHAGCKGFGDVFCQPNYINPAFVGFSPADLDTIIVKQFSQNDSFDNLIDSLLVIDPVLNNGLGYAIYTSWSDTTLLTINVGAPHYPIMPGYDWTIYIPAKNKTITISQIKSPVESGNKNCSNPITSFIQDGQLISNPVYIDSSGNDWWFNGYRVYIHP